jgi:hypothetical protein
MKKFGSLKNLNKIKTLPSLSQVFLWVIWEVRHWVNKNQLEAAHTTLTPYLVLFPPRSASAADPGSIFQSFIKDRALKYTPFYYDE